MLFLADKAGREHWNQGGDKAYTQFLSDSISAASTYIDEVEGQIKKATILRDRYSEALTVWNAWRDQHSLDPNPEVWMAKLDRTWRYEAFWLACHYWEGRWIVETSADLGKDLEGQGPAKVKRRWRKMAMLFPCFVSTLHKAPAAFNAFQKGPVPLYGFIDLLIIDEAGQVAPHFAGATFSLAKRALVVGDRKQLEPVRQLTQKLDLVNLLRHGVAADVDAAETLRDQGLSAMNDLMMASEHACIVDQDGKMGLMLREHFRCVPEIIGYCNDLAYEGRLIPLREQLGKRMFPALGYAHVQGVAVQQNGSWINGDEARTAVNWISSQDALLRATYPGKSLSEIVGIVTPFAAQAGVFQRLLAETGMKSVEVGTVHRFQGGEKPVIIFSTTYDKTHERGYFFNRGVNMLNVAVSRAKDSFLVFGDSIIFTRCPPGSPGQLLAQHLYKNGQQIQIH